jgi:hypothetical protein
LSEGEISTTLTKINKEEKMITMDKDGQDACNLLLENNWEPKRIIQALCQSKQVITRYIETIRSEKSNKQDDAEKRAQSARSRVRVFGEEASGGVFRDRIVKLGFEERSRFFGFGGEERAR